MPGQRRGNLMNVLEEGRGRDYDRFRVIPAELEPNRFAGVDALGLSDLVIRPTFDLAAWRNDLKRLRSDLDGDPVTSCAASIQIVCRPCRCHEGLVHFETRVEEVRQAFSFFSRDLLIVGPSRVLVATTEGVFALDVPPGCPMTPWVDDAFEGDALRGPMDLVVTPY